ncbi:ornithine decarboxylase-like [Euphorbia lathyris]|uniref:ornithine decarboxylase-like n=1 Tax=Euphorbia lathyris TaxID=212925 RepID=UPI0033141AD6
MIVEKAENKEAFYVLNFGEVSGIMDRWSNALPNVQPFYAVKCNPDMKLLSKLQELGCNFDCASKFEIEAILSLGVSPDRIIYANPCKEVAHLKYAASVGVNLTTFDSKYELEKIVKWHPKCDLLLRIKAPDDISGAILPLSSKYGADLDEVESLLEIAKAAQLNIAGVSFHIGSGCTNPMAFRAVIASTKQVFDMASRLGMNSLQILNIGGGFTATPKFEEAATIIRSAIHDYFGETTKQLRIIAEPGRYIAENVFTLAANVVGKRVRGELREYWINEGMYSSFNALIYGCATLIPTPFACNSNPCNPTRKQAPTYVSKLYGPTCAAVDTITQNLQLPDLEVDDWIIFSNMGSYTSCCGTSFNGFNTATTSFVYTPNIESLNSKL